MLDHPKLAGWQPPSNYQPVSSTLEGITVFAPRPADVVVEDPTTYKCPQCGATTKYDIAAGGVACEHCGYTAAAQAQKVGMHAQRSEFTLETLSQAEKGWGLDRRVLHCDSCGAELAIAEGALTATCPFCASNRVNLRQAPSENLRPRFVIPFKITTEVLHQRAHDWLGKGWFHPDGLADSSAIDRFTGVYLSFWTFDANIGSDWNAEVGYERQERYYDASAKEFRTRTVIDWHWERGHVVTQVKNLLISGTSRLSRLILEKVYPFNLNDLETYSPDFLAGWQALTYDITLPKAWETGKASMRDKAKSACYADIPTNHVRNFSMSADFSDEAWRYVLLPVYVAAYQFETKTYQVMVNGQTGTVAGQKPVAWWKIWLAIGLLLAPGLLLGLVGLVLSAAGIGGPLLGVAVILFIIGAILSVIIYRQATASEAA
jgi:DNA-directed RNA polymerase subunit RPC12/RpoP